MLDKRLFMEATYRDAHTRSSLSYEAGALIGSLLWIMREVNVAEDIAGLVDKSQKFIFVRAFIPKTSPPYVLWTTCNCLKENYSCCNL